MDNPKMPSEPWGKRDGTFNIVAAVEKIFADENNFDISGFVKPELISVGLADCLAKINDLEYRQLLKRGYRFVFFAKDEAMILKDVRNKKSHYTLKLYYNQTYPKEVEKLLEAEKKKGAIDNDQSGE